MVEEQLAHTKVDQYELLASYLRLSREVKVPNWQLVLTYGERLLEGGRHCITEEEVWNVHEQVVLAALSCNVLHVADKYLTPIIERFPVSKRATKLKAFCLEAREDYKGAEAKYKEILEEDPNNESVRKRLVALEKSQGNLLGAIQELNKYLEVFMSDKEAWEELAELYTTVGMYRQAAYCWEELLLMGPSQIHYHLRYADILYTLGGATNLKAARTYYSKAVQLSNGLSTRALYGIAACSAHLQDKGAGSDLTEASVDVLLKLYGQHAPSKVEVVRAGLRQ